MISVVLPTFNEALNIKTMVMGVNDYISDTDEIIVIDDNSPDNTTGVVEEISKTHPHIRVICRKDEAGLTSAIQRGIDESKGDVVVWMDADLSQSPKYIPEMVRQIQEENWDIVVGSRYVKGGADARFGAHSLTVWVQILLSLTLRLGTSLILWEKFADWSSGYIAIRKDKLNELTPLSGDYGEYFIRLIYLGLKKGHKVKEVPYILPPRELGESKTATNLWGLVTKGIMYLAMVVALRLGFQENIFFKD